jgi:hypothetical protein
VLTVVTDNEPTPAATTPTAAAAATTGGSLIDEIVRDGARRMLAAALEAEVAAYIAAHADQLDEHGRRLVVRNGRAEPVLDPGDGQVNDVTAPDLVAAVRVSDVDGGRCSGGCTR